MREERFFYAPEIQNNPSLPDEEAQHAVRVLRLTEGDEVWAMDGHGSFYRCAISSATKRTCNLDILEEHQQKRSWLGTLTLAVAPTKNMDRTEWMVEKAVEIGVDRIVPLLCKNSERAALKTERLERIAVSAMKQSRKPWLTEIVPLTPFDDFIKGDTDGYYIAHCYDNLGERHFLMDVVEGLNLTVMIGPEGDFSPEEVRMALDKGCLAVSLGASRLRTETAGVVATHIMQLKNAIR